ncbi:PD-(D/E)XK nuclease family protein [uncultured Brachyspira sp.]|uniref:PD-(D/E)XK nuclease family protein n=1 Tax=uncultured Brachyspira sp. TaxID=221953 RepID=UPI00259ABBC3|nr:PD-(D/E)XK nuclease family protein [uncultured Brachyspira sp.]
MEYNYNIEELKKTWDFYDNESKEIIENAFSITSKFIDEDMLKRYREYIDKNNFEENYPFNIFELISDIYYRENFHSDIIAKLFENEIVLKNFLDFIGVDKSKYENYEVEREESKIDILIKTEKNCIIVENKLNWAKDMPEQLFRYYNECKNNKKLEVDKIVYLSPNSWKQPEEQSIKEIPKELIKTIIGYDGENNDFYTMVLQKSLEEMNNKEPKEWHLLLEHYLKILRQTGETKMDKLTKEFYDKIVNDGKEYEKIELIATMYNDLIKTRINNLASTFSGENYNNECFYRDFYSEKRGLNYAIDIYANDYKYSYLQLFSREEGTATDDNPKSTKKWEQDNKDIEAWLKKHKLFDGFYFDDWRWTKDFKFPEEEKALYEFAKKLIECLEKDIESIYSGK